MSDVFLRHIRSSTWLWDGCTRRRVLTSRCPAARAVRQLLMRQQSSRLLRVKWALLQWWFTCLCAKGSDVCAVIIRSSSISRAQSRLLDNLRCHRQKHCRDQIYSGVYSFTTLLTVTSSGSTTESTSFMFSHDDQWSVLIKYRILISHEKGNMTCILWVVIFKNNKCTPDKFRNSSFSLEKFMITY